MPDCYICGSDFSRGFTEPSYPCACGCMVTRRDLREMTDDRVRHYIDLKASWEKGERPKPTDEYGEPVE